MQTSALGCRNYLQFFSFRAKNGVVDFRAGAAAGADRHLDWSRVNMARLHNTSPTPQKTHICMVSMRVLKMVLGCSQKLFLKKKLNYFSCFSKVFQSRVSWTTLLNVYVLPTHRMSFQYYCTRCNFIFGMHTEAAATQLAKTDEGLQESI